MFAFLSSHVRVSVPLPQPLTRVSLVRFSVKARRGSVKAACSFKTMRRGSVCSRSRFSLIEFDCIGSAITGPIGKECADLWPRIASAANAIV